MEMQSVIIFSGLACCIAIAGAGVFWLRYQKIKKELALIQSHSGDNESNENIVALIDNLYLEKKLNEELATREEELTASEEELRQSMEMQKTLLDKIQLKEASLSALINNTNDLIFSLDENFCLVEFNNPMRAFYSKLGAKIHKGVHLSNFVTPKNLPNAIQILTNVMTGEPRSAVFDIIDKEGIKTFYESKYNPIHDERDRVIGISIMIREITERIKSEQILRASEEKYSKAFKSSPDSVMITTVRDAKIIELNEGFLSFSGYTREEVTGKSTIELGFWDPAERANLRELLLKHGRVIELEVHLKIKSGEIRDCLISAETIEIDGELCLVSITRDITIRKRNQELLIELLNNEKQLNQELQQREEELSSNEEELRQSFESQSRLLEEIQLKEASVSALMNNTRDIIYSLDNEYCLTEFNATVYSFYKEKGITLRKGLHLKDFISARNYPDASRVFSKAMNGEHTSYNFDAPSENGYDHFEGYYNPIYNDSKEVLGVSVFIRNITERRIASDAIKASEEKYSKWFRCSPDSIIISTIDDARIIEVNDGFELLSGFKREEVIGKTTRELNFYDDPEIRTELERLLKKDKRITNHELKGKKKSGEFMSLLVSAEPIEIQGKQCMISVSRDMTEQKKSAEKIRQSEALLNNLIDNLPMGLQIFDKNGSTLKINETQRKLLNMQKVGTDNGKFNALQDPVNINLGTDQLFIKALNGERTENFEIAVDFAALNDPRYAKTDKVWYNLWLFPLLNENNKPEVIISLLADITQRKLNEEKIEKTNEELIQLNQITADYKLMALRSAMNPHFIFNAMNSIQYFISKNERENALIYLSLFSKLIRNILTGTVENKTTIHHEMETLQNYIELENLRFDMKFEVHYEIDESLSIRHLEIPSLLLQPYVENAILHGLYNKNGKGTLLIKIVPHTQNTIIFVIEDNGVGREEAKKIKQNNQINNHKSIGMTVTKERLDIINKRNNISVVITDLYDNEGKAAGTRIEIYVEI
jgi:PAS domain S-box-containing protein